MLLWWLNELLFTATLCFNIEVSDDAQINNELYTLLNFFNQGTNL